MHPQRGWRARNNENAVPARKDDHGASAARAATAHDFDSFRLVATKNEANPAPSVYILLPKKVSAES